MFENILSRVGGWVGVGVGGWVGAGSNENKAKLSLQAKLDLKLGLSLAKFMSNSAVSDLVHRKV